MKRFIAILLFLIAFLPAAKAQTKGEIYGTVIDEKGNPLPGVLVKASKNNRNFGGAISEDDGSYSIKLSQPGTYSIEFRGYKKIYSRRVINGVGISVGGIVKLNCKMQLKLSKSVIETEFSRPFVPKYVAANELLKQWTGCRSIPSNPNRGLRIGGYRPEGVIPTILVSEEKDSVIIDENQYQFKAQNKTYTEKDYKYLPLPTFLQSLPDIKR